VENRPLAARVTQLYLEPEDGRPLVHEPGQFVYLTPHDPGLAAGRDEEHPFTVSSAPGATLLEITVKDLGNASRALLEVAVRSPASLEGPYGDFLSPRLRGRRQLWIGGGVGITPFVSAARARAGVEGEPGSGGRGWGDTVLINCANDPSRAYLLGALQTAARELEDLSVHPHYYAREGPLSVGFVLERCPDAAERDWFVCGPPVLVELSRRLARELGVPRRHFHSEDFVFL
jgi:predicted ferric reductase